MSIHRAAAFLLAFSAAVLSAQPPQPRITRRIDNARLVRLPRTTHPIAGRARDLGRADAGLAMDRILLELRGSPEQDAALEQLLAGQHDPASPDFGRWLTPEEFGERFGPAQQDIDAIARWLESQGFTVAGVALGRRSLEISGTVDAVERAFHTRMHRYEWQGESHLANATDIAIPAALTGVVAGVVSLHDFHSRSQLRGPGGSARPEPVPLANLSTGGHALGPYDFAAIYNLTPLWNQSFDGAGQTIAVAGRSNVRATDFSAFRSLFGLPANPPEIVVNGSDPGIVSNDEEFEADLDIQWSGAVAKGAAVKFVVSKSTSTTDGIDLSSQYIVNHNLAAVVSLSFGACENDMGSNNSFYNALWQQAAAQGMSVFVSSGDSGSAGCDAAFSGTPATQGLAVNGLASTAYNVAVGGTQFADTANPAAYWNSTSDAHLASARGYIPETVWNESAGSPAASGGGYSILWRAPSWQSGGSVPPSQWRMIPDVSLAAAGRTGYLVMHGGSLYLVAGTSASAPAFAGLMAVVNQYTGRRNGNPNTRLYPLAAQTPAVFHDVTSGTNAVPCVSGTVNCSGSAGGTGVTGGYTAASGFDAATGLGSVDAFALAVNWGTASTLPAAPAITSFNPNPMPATASAQSLTIAGSGFASGATVTASYPGYSVKLAVSALSSTRISASIAAGTAARAWTVTVVNPNGQSASSTLMVTAPAPAIASLSPNPMTPSASPQTLTITGSGFASGATVVLSYPGYAQTVSGSQLTVAGPNQLALPITVGTAARSWSVQVVSASGQVSNIATLTVAAPVSSPVIASLNPGAMSRSSTAQTLTINGSGFATSGAFIVLISPASAMLLTPKTAAATQLQVSFVPGTAARTYSVQVVNPGGKISNPVNLVIR